MSTTAALLADVAKHVKTELVQRDDEVDAIMLALVSGHHVLLVGEPGIGKTLAADRIAVRIDGTNFFDLPMGPFTGPEDLFGNPSIQGIKEDRLEYRTPGMVQDAYLALFDEWNRAGKGVLQTCMKLWNERKMRNGGKTVKVNLSTGIFTCNFLIDDKDSQELAAVFDRILLRKVSHPVIDVDGLRELAKVDLDPDPPVICTWADVEQAKAEVRLVDVPDSVLDTYIEVFGALTVAGHRPSNRRWREALRLVQASAYLDGRTVAETVDLLPLVDVFWTKPDDRREIERVMWPLISEGLGTLNELMDGVAEAQALVDAVLTMEPGPDFMTACSEARTKIKQNAEEVLKTRGTVGPAGEAQLDDVWRRLQGIHDRVMAAMDLPPIPLQTALNA